MSIKQRVALAGGSAIGGTGEPLGATLGEEFQPLVDTLDVASIYIINYCVMLLIHQINCIQCHVITGSVIKDQATADEDTSLKDRGLQAISKYIQSQ